MHAEVNVPASKSLTNRYLLLAALAEGPSTVINPLESRDTELMLRALQQLGAVSERVPNWQGTGEHAYRITPIPFSGSRRRPGPGDSGSGSGSDPEADAGTEAWAEAGVEPRGAEARGAEAETEERVAVDCGLAGTVMRFLPAVAALTGRTVDFDGDPEARVRPMGAVLEGLRALDVAVTGHRDDADDERPADSLPFTISSPAGVSGGEIAIDASASSQFVSGLLLAAPLMRQGLTLRHTGETVPSSEHIEMTMEVLRDLGVSAASPEPWVWQVSPGGIAPFTVRVEPDLSNAGPFLAAALATGGRVSMRGWPQSSTQIGRRWTQLLEQFGGNVQTTPEPSGSTCTLTVRGGVDEFGKPAVSTPGTVTGTAELTPTVAALAALAAEPTTFREIQHLRGHETDRIAALVAELQRLGARAEETEDGFTILAPARSAATVRTYADHRMATFGAIIGLAIPEVRVEDITCTSKTMPAFPELWHAMVEGSPRPL